MALRPQYDVIVVGAGISGLYAARELLKKHPSLHVALAERYKGLGGRTYSYWPPGFEGVHWEMGAGRVHKSHKMVMNLIKEYGLHWTPIGDDIDYLSGPGGCIVKNPFDSVFIPVYIEPLSRLSPDILATHTVEELMNRLYGREKTREILGYFPYRAEVNTLRADLALKGFLGGGEMGTQQGYGIVQEGFGELVARMRRDLEERGCTILQRHRLLNLRKAGNATDLDFQFGYESGKITLRAEKAVVLALHKDAISEIPIFKGWKLLDSLKTRPLLRIYAIFSKPWFSGMNRIVTPERPRYILPIDPSKGVIMISYTDAENTAEYTKIQKKGGDKALEKAVMKDIRKLFPDVPDPVFFRSHPWTTGATYWIPGSYTPQEEALQPFPGVWVCGESWSLRQAWVEGALEQTRLCLDKILI